MVMNLVDLSKFESNIIPRQIEGSKKEMRRWKND